MPGQITTKIQSILAEAGLNREIFKTTDKPIETYENLGQATKQEPVETLEENRNISGREFNKADSLKEYFNDEYDDEYEDDYERTSILQKLAKRKKQRQENDGHYEEYDEQDEYLLQAKKNTYKPEVKEEPRKSITRQLPRQSYNGVNVIGDIDKTAIISVPSTVEFLKKRGISDRLARKAETLMGIFLIKLYIILANVYDLFLPDILKFYQRPYMFWLVNMCLMIIAMILAVDVIVDGVKRGVFVNVNTLVTYTSVCSLIHIASVIFMQNPLGYLPFSSIQVLLLHFAVKSLSADERNLAYMYKLNSMQSETVSVTNSRKGKRGYIVAEKDDGKYKETTNTNNTQIIYVYLSIIFTISFAIFAGGGELNKTLYVLSAITSVILPINYVYILPKRRLTKALFREGISIPEYNHLGMFAKNRTMAITDKDLFAQGTIKIKALKLCGKYSLEDILNLGYLGFSLIDSPTKYAFEEKMAYINTNLVAEIGENTKNGFTFIYSGRKISVGNSTYVISLGLPAGEGSKAKHPMYFVIDNMVVAVIDLEFAGSPNIYDLLEQVERERMEIMLETLDFNIKPDIIKKLYDLDEIVYPEFEKRNNIKTNKYYNNKPIKIKRFTGDTYIMSVLYANKINKLTKRNAQIGVICITCAVTLVAYLCIAFEPALLLPHNLLLLLIVWYMPSILAMLMTYKV